MHGPNEQPRTVSADASTIRMFAHLRSIVAVQLSDPAAAHEMATTIWSTVHGVVSLIISKPEFPWPGPSPQRFAERSVDRVVSALIEQP